MKTEHSMEWWIARAHREGDGFIGAGIMALDPLPEERVPAATPDEGRIAFGKFVNMMRRRQGLSMEKLAEEADLDASELLIIEGSAAHVPDPRTVYRLAQTFKVSQQRLMQLAGLTVANDDSLFQEAVRFAARSESVQKLTAEESSALEAFVAVLSEQEPRRG